MQPSLLIRGNSGIFVNVNDEYVIQGDDAKNARAAMTLIKDVFDDSIGNSEWIIDQLMVLTKKG